MSRGMYPLQEPNSPKLHPYDIRIARALRWLKSSLHMMKPLTVIPYVSYGGKDFVTLSGRVVEQIPNPLRHQKASWIKNGLDLLRLFLRCRGEGYHIHLSLGDYSTSTICDGVGYFQASLPLPSITNHVATWQWQCDQLQPQRGTAPCHIVSQASSAPGIISDIDDTVLESHASDLRRTTLLTFTNNASSRIAITGMNDLYRRLVSTEDPHPIFYVTSSSWSLYPLIKEFLSLNAFPSGPILMQKTGISNNKFISRGHQHKYEKIKKILQTTNQQTFYLFGDSGQADRHIYQQVCVDFPERIRGVFVRKVANREGGYEDSFAALNIPYLEFSLVSEIEDFLARSTNAIPLSTD